MRPPRRPPALRAGDLVGIAAPASPVREDLLERGEDALRAMGFVPRRAPNLLRRDRYTAGSAAERAADLNQLLADPEVRAIFFARGGYGSVHLLELLDAKALDRDPKLLVGASDLTTLLLWSLKLGVACVHGPMPAREFQEGRVDPAEMLAHLTRPEPFGALAAPGARSIHPGRASGRITGGCLSLVAASLATRFEIDCDDGILFLEDADLKPYQVDRMLTQLRLAGKLDRVRGIAFGEMPRCQQNESQGYSLDQVLGDLTLDLGIPVVTGLPCGHTTGVHRPLPFGVQATLDADRVELRFDEAVVS
jgi:muramoyltetrapeptide carboxypeptidase